MRHLLIVLLLAATACSAEPRPADSQRQANPLGLFYDNSFDNIELYEHPGALLVAGNCNRYDEHFRQARAKGAEVLAYLNGIEVYDRIPCKLNESYYMGGRENVPLWPYPSYGVRVNWPKTHLADMRVGSRWADNVVEYIAELMQEGKVDGVYLDNVGARLWGSLSDWVNWPQDEMDAWTAGNVDIVRRIDEKRRAINPGFIIVTNNLWDRSDPKGFAGEKYVDGVCIERSNFNAYHQRYAGRAFGDLGHRRLLVIAKGDEDAVKWSFVPGVTHVSGQIKNDHPGKPLVPFSPMADTFRPR
jgi:hypothetical protein